jgi:hypothetical protein
MPQGGRGRRFAEERVQPGIAPVCYDAASSDLGEETQMHARLSRFAGLDGERIDATVRQFEEDALASLEQQPGFRGLTVGVDYQSGRAFAIGLWESQADMSRSEHVATEAIERAIATVGPARTPIVDHYEVVIHR